MISEYSELIPCRLIGLQTKPEIDGFILHFNNKGLLTPITDLLRNLNVTEILVIKLIIFTLESAPNL